MGKKKRRGHYCKACGRTRPNEKFSGKGHRQHICKDCKRKGKKATHTSTYSGYERELQQLSKAIKNCLILHADQASFFLFEYKNERYITRDDFGSEIFVFHGKRFYVSEAFDNFETRLEALYIRYYHTLESELSLDYDWLDSEWNEVSKTRRKHLEVIGAMKNLSNGGN